MKFLNLQLRAFGRFTNRTLDFASADRNFHVIYGANEAGKSTSLRAVKGLLFEIPSRSADDFLHKSAALRIAAELVRQDGQRRVFVRRKGNKDTLLDEHDQPLPPAELSGFLGNLGSSTFDSVFCLDHHVLRQGGEDLLAGKGELAESLFQAGTGLTGLRITLTELEEEAEKIFKPRGSAGKLNKSLTDYDDSRRRSRESSLAPKDWAEQSGKLAAMRTDLEALKTSLQSSRAQFSRLSRYQIALKHFNQYKLRHAELEELVRVVSLPHNAAQEHAQARSKMNQAVLQIEHARTRIADLQQQLEKLVVPEELLAQAQTIDVLVQRLDSYRNALHDLPEVKADQERRIAGALDSIATIKPGLPLDQAESLRITGSLRERVNRLAREHPGLTARIGEKRRVLESARKNAAATEAEVAASPIPPSLDGLENALENCRAQGDLEAQLQEEEHSANALDCELGLLQKRLGLWSDTAATGLDAAQQPALSNLIRLRLPLPESLDRYDRELQALTKTQEKLAEQAKRLQESLANVERATQSLQLAGAVPTEADLTAARARRELGWQLVRRAWLDQSPDAEAEQGFDSQLKLPEAYSQSVKNADDLADRLRREADRCAHLAKLHAGKAEDEKALHQVVAQQNELNGKIAEWQARWTAEWQSAGFSPLTPVEMRGWLSRHAVIVQKAEELRRVQERVDRLKQNLKLHHAALRGELEKLGHPPMSGVDSLGALIKSAKKLSQRITDASDIRRDLEKNARRHQKDIAHGEEELQQSRQALEEWQTQWAESLSRAQFLSDTLPEDAIPLLAKLDGLFSSLKEQAGVKLRIEQMREYLEDFERDVRALVGALAPDLASLPPDAAAEQMQARVSRAKSDDVKRNGLRQQLAREQATLLAAESDRSQAEANWKTLLDRARCATSADLDVAEQKSRQKQEKEQNLASHREALENQSGGVPFDVFMEDLAAINLDELPGRITDLEQAIRQDESRQAELNQSIALAARNLSESDHSVLAAQAAQETQESLAQIRESSLQYARLRLAAEMLRRQMEQHREKNQDPVIRRASELFPRLTLGSFARLKVGFDERDQSVLLGVRPAGDEVTVSSMSDGTRDQLFLALRLASLERQLQASEPVPLIVDDILINFDDDRSRATLEVLRDISRLTQVLFFTHHTRLKELAREVIGDTQCCVHEL